MSQTLTHDLCVIGAGVGGFAAARTARALGAEVVVVDRRPADAAHVEPEALAAAALQESARHAHAMRTAPAFGVTEGEPRVDFARLREHVRTVVSGAAPNGSARHLAAMGVTVVSGEGRFADAATLTVGDTPIRARRFIIATGAVPTLPPIAGLDTVPFFTCDTIFANARRISHLVVVGAGATGAEFGQAFRRLGAEVTLIEQGMPLAEADPELAEVALRRLQEEGVLIRTGTSVPAVAPREGGGVVVTIRTSEAEDTISASHILIATGRAPNLDLNLERAGIRRSRTEPNRLELDDELRTSNRRVHAVGDAAGGALQSAQRAAYDGRLAARAALLGFAGPHRPEDVPVVFHTDPPIAWVGLDERAAAARHRNRFRVTRLPFAESDRARAGHRTFGLIKLTTALDGRILGAGIVGPEAGELVAIFALAIANRLTIEHLARMPAPYPTLAGILPRLAEAAREERPLPLLERALRAVNRLLP